MADSKNAIFLELPSASGQLVLHPAKISRSESDRYTATPVSTDLAFEVDQRLMIYYFNRREFMKRLVVVESLERAQK